MHTERMNVFSNINEEEINQNNDTEHYNKKVQDSMFVDLFSTQGNLLDLYHSLHPEDVSVQLSDIKNITLTDVFVKGLKNDVGLLVGNRIIILTEHQSTVNENMPVRALLYYAEQLKRYLFSDDSRRRKVFQKKLIKLPYPEFYVVCTDDESEFSDSELQLSDAFAVKDFINVKVKVISQRNLKTPGLLSEYLEFIRILKDKINKCNNNRKDAIKETIKNCIESGILTDYLNARKEEVTDMLMEEMTIEELIGTAEENRMDGIQEGIQKERLETILSMKKNGITVDKIAAVFNYSVDQVNNILQAN